MKKLFLLDAFALIFRAHFAFIARPLMNSKGQNVSAITGFVNSLWDVLQKEKPTHIAVGFDLPTPTFRHIAFDAYKANRDAAPEDIVFAVPYIQRILRAFNIPVVSAEGYEADDVIGTLAKQAAGEGFEVYMVTPDKDYGQLVASNIFLYKPARLGNDVEIWDEQKVLEEWGIANVEQVIDCLALQGDASDNIPGVKGIGPKTAQKLLAEYGSIEGVLANKDKLTGKVREAVEQHGEAGILSKMLARIALDVPVRFDADEYEVKPFNRAELTEVFKELEFRNLSARILGKDALAQDATTASPPDGVQTDLFGNVVHTTLPKEKSNPTEKTAEEATPAPQHIASKNSANTPHQYDAVTTPEALQQLLDKLQKHTQWAFDTETTHIDATRAELVGLSFAVQAGEAYYVPISANYPEAIQQLAPFKPLLENPAIRKIGQNIKYDLTVLKHYHIHLQGELLDTMLMHYLLEPELRHNMNYLAETYLDYAPISIETLIGEKGATQQNMRDVPLQQIKEYAAEDADITLQLYQHLYPKLDQNQLTNLYQTIEAPLVSVLASMEYEGVRIDPQFLLNYSVELGTHIEEARKKVFDQAGVQFNIDSPKQVGDVLFGLMKIPYRWAKTKTQQFSTNEEKLSELAEKYQIAQDILHFRSLTKLKSTYVDTLPKLINPKTQRIHSSFNQAVASTGRLSSNNPNLQNIPIKTAAGIKIRQAFIPRNDDYLLLSADYSQIELRLIAHMSNDQAMIQAFNDELDIHLATAAKVYNVPLNQVTPTQRRNAKTVNFSIIYGAGAQNLSQQLDIPRAEAKELIEQYFVQYSNLKKYMDDTVAFARTHGYVQTLLGRRRHIRDIDSRNGLTRSQAERTAINTPVQGTAADLIKAAMIQIHHQLQQHNLRSKLILQVHDELVFDVYKPELNTVQSLVKHAMEHAIPNLQVPLRVSMGTGNNWREAH